MTKNKNNEFWLVIIIFSFLTIFTLIKIIFIKKSPIYIFAQITGISVGRQSSIFYKFTFKNKLYKDGMTASPQGLSVGSYYLIEFEKSDPNNCRPIFNVDSWRCVLNDSNYYYGSSKKPDCDSP
jgi:hypothetical protein